MPPPIRHLVGHSRNSNKTQTARHEFAHPYNGTHVNWLW
jgi:hypothetical protein